MKFHFQVISTTREELNPVISGDNDYEAWHTLIEVCKNNNVIPTRIIQVDACLNDDDIPCIIS